jgi:hypothetical protein
VVAGECGKAPDKAGPLASGGEMGRFRCGLACLYALRETAWSKLSQVPASVAIVDVLDALNGIPLLGLLLKSVDEHVIPTMLWWGTGFVGIFLTYLFVLGIWSWWNKWDRDMFVIAHMVARTRCLQYFSSRDSSTF